METNTRFAKELKLDYPILSDPGKEIARSYGVLTAARPYPNRVTFYIDKQGKIAFIDAQVSTRSHGDDIVKKLRELKFEEVKGEG